MKRITFLSFVAMAAIFLPTCSGAVLAQKADSLQKAVPELSRNARAGLRQEVLDSLFGKLHNVKSPERAKFLVSAIWKLWSHTDSPTAKLLLAQSSRAMAAKQHRTAIAILSTIIDQYPDFTEAWNKRATAYFIVGDYERSLADIKQVLDREPRHFGALSGQGLIYSELGKNKKALSAFRRALAINPHLKDAKRAIKRLSGKVEQDI
jgi:tetratricopeptide (TPR) repeat protein